MLRRPLTPRERDQLHRLLSSPIDLPGEFKDWVTRFIDANPPRIPYGNIAGNFKLVNLSTVARDRLVPGEGQAIWNTDTDSIEVWTGSEWSTVFSSLEGVFVEGSFQFGDSQIFDDVIDIKEQPSSGFQTPNLVQQVSGNTLSGSTISATWSAPTRSGSLLLAWLHIFDPDGTAPGPTPPGGWELEANLTHGTAAQSVRLYRQTTGASDSGAVTFTLGDTVYAQLVLEEWDGVEVGDIDDSGTDTSTDGTIDINPIGNTPQNDMLVVFSANNCRGGNPATQAAQLWDDETLGGPYTNVRDLMISVAGAGWLSSRTASKVLSSIESPQIEIEIADDISRDTVGIIATFPAKAASSDAEAPDPDFVRIYAKDVGDATGLYARDEKGNIHGLQEPPGVVKWTAAGTAPDGYLVADGSAVSRDTYSALFDAIGTTYGTGDGSTTFNLPNLKGKVPVGLDSGQTEFDALGETGGSKTHTLSSGEMPSHSHGAGSYTAGGNLQTNTTTGGSANRIANMTDDGGVGDNGTANIAGTSGSTGGGGAHNNLQPYITLTPIIKY